MAGLGTIAKAVENLRKLLEHDSSHFDNDSRKKEKISCCGTLANGISSSVVKADPRLLTRSIEILLILCDDQDADVRTTADESLNKIIRSVADTYIVKVQVELFKEIKRNGVARSLKAALWRFGTLSSSIRSVKAKNFISQLSPCIAEISKRKEDFVIDALLHSMPLMLKTLGPFMSDKDVNILLKAFFQNLSAKEPICRRAAAAVILTTCLNCRKPQRFLKDVIDHLLENFIRIIHQETGNEEDRTFSILGLFGCLRAVLPFVTPPLDDTENEVLDKFLCIYELCLHFVKFHQNHNVINAALETLVELLQNPLRNLTTALLSTKGIGISRIDKTSQMNTQGKLNSSRVSLSTTTVSTDDNLEASNLFEHDLIDIPEITSNIEKWIIDSADAVPLVQQTPKRSELLHDSIVHVQKDTSLDNYSSLVIGSSEKEETEDGSDISSEVGKFEKIMHSTQSSRQNIKEDVELDGIIQSGLSHLDLSFNALPANDLEIGSFNDVDIPLKYCCRLLVSTFLLTGKSGELTSDKSIRVSVKSLALTALGQVIKHSPLLFFETVVKFTNDDVKDKQLISDILLYSDHQDPQIRGNISMVIGNYLKAVLRKCGDISNIDCDKSTSVEELIKVTLKGLEDESATTCCQTLTAFGIFLPKLLESTENKYAIPILKVLPRLVKNPYFLVKVKLAEVASELPYSIIYHLTGSSEFQEIIIDVFMKLLGDQDKRVRFAASGGIVKIIPLLYYESAHENAVSRTASFYTERYLSSIVAAPVDWTSCRIEHKFLLNGLIKPFDALLEPENSNAGRINDSLSRIIGILMENFLFYSSKTLTYGCIEALSMISDNFFTTTYPDAWDCSINSKVPVKKSKKTTRVESVENLISNDIMPSISVNLLSYCINILTTSPLSLDMSAQRHLLLLTGNLIAGIACQIPRSKETTSKTEETNSSDILWSFFIHKQMSSDLESLLRHLLRVLNIFVYVIEDIPWTPPATKTSIPLLSNSPKKKFPLDEKREKSEKLLFRFGKDQMGSFSGIPHYTKLYETLKSAHANFRATLDNDASEMYISLLNANLELLSVILEVATINEGGRIAEEVLGYLQSIVTLSTTKTIQCVRQCLKCLFGTNLVARWNYLCDSKEIQRKENIRESEFCRGNDAIGIYERCFQRPVRLMAETIKNIGNNCRGGNEPSIGQRWKSSIHGWDDRKVPSILKILSRNLILASDQNSVGSFIRLFEPLVIKSLIQYTVSNSVPLQCQVLMLLSELVQLHINYCLMDSDKIFIGFVMKQFELIEDGHIPLAHELLPRIFDFLVRLSYEKYHSKLIIGIPKIIQLCDGLMASGQLPSTHCIPALVPVAEEMFLTRNNTRYTNATEEKEFETTRDVLIWMMLRLVEYPRIIGLLSNCLAESRSSTDGNGEERWRRWSRLTMNTFLPLLGSRKVQIETREAFFAVVKLCGAVSPTVYRPVDPLLKVLFSTPPVLQPGLPLTSIVELERWLGTVNVMLLSLISFAKEEVMLARLTDVTASMTDLPELLESGRNTNDPLNVTGLQPFDIPPDVILAKFLFRVIRTVSSALVELFTSGYFDDNNEFLIYQFGMFLQLCIHMFESGSNCKVANASMRMIRKEKAEISLDKSSDSILEIGRTCPVIACQWTYLMTLLGFEDMDFWSKVIGQSSSRIMNADIVKKGATILFCDYVCENINDAEPLTWLLVNHIEATVDLANESPVKELLAVAVHRNPSASGLLIQAVAARCLDLSRPSFVKRLLNCVEGAHQSQSGALLMMLIPRFLKSKYLALSRMAAKIASRRVEVLLTLGIEEVNEQIAQVDFLKIIEVLQTEQLARKHSGLVGLLNKLAVKCYDASPLQVESYRPMNTNVGLDRTWFISQVRSRCSYPNISYGCLESARLLQHLDFEECSDIFSSKDFNVKILKECIILGARLTVEKCQQIDFGVNERYQEAPLFSAAKVAILQRIRNINGLIPKPHQHSSKKYAAKFTELMSDDIYRNAFFDVVPAAIVYINSLPKLSQFGLSEVGSEYEEDLAKFAILCLEVADWQLRSERAKPEELELTLNCAQVILQVPTTNRAFGNEGHYSWVCSAVETLVYIVEYFTKEPLPPIEECGGLQEAYHSEETRQYAVACSQMDLLVQWLEKRRIGERIECIPVFILAPLDSLIVNISRMPLVNSFVLIPSLLWKHGWQAKGSGPTKCQFMLLFTESNVLHEIDVLEEFIFRITLLGWTSRQQFEEIWMALLSVLNVSQQKEVESEESSRIGSLAVQAMTRLLTHTLILPCPGNPENGSPIHHTRDPQLSLQKKSSQRLFAVQDLLLWKYECNDIRGEAARLEHIFDRGNLERRNDEFIYGQLSVSYLWSMCSLHEDKLSSSTLELKKKRNEALASSFLDVDSCLKFLLDLYSSWMLHREKITLRLLQEVVKSILCLSELFTERSQFQYMLDFNLELAKVHPAEDEILQRYLVVSACKAAAVLAPMDADTLDKVKRLVENNLKFGALPARVAALHGLLYLLQSAVLANCEDTMKAVDPLTIDYIQKHIDVPDSNRPFSQSEEHQSIMWALVFFLLEHAEDSPPDNEVPAVLELILSLACSSNISTSLHRMLLQGLERLVATKSVVGKVAEQVVKVAMERMKQANPILALPALQLLLTCMYTDTADRFNQPDIEEPLPDVEPEILVRSIERSSAIFDKIKRGYPMEVEILCSILSEVLVDFFPPSEILTKVIGEFLSPQQPHPRLMSAVVFKVCESACKSAQLELLQEWVVFSLPSFIQSLPLVMSTWCLSCFFISASTNQWLRSLFPHVQSRIGKYEYEDKRILCISAIDFYSQLSSEQQKEMFLKTFQDAAKEPGSPFNDVVASF